MLSFFTLVYNTRGNNCMSQHRRPCADFQLGLWKSTNSVRILTQPSRYKKRNQFASWRLYIYIFYGSIRTRKLKNFVHVPCLIMNFRRQPVGKRRRIFCNFNMSCRHVRISFFFCGGWVGVIFFISYFSLEGICTL